MIILILSLAFAVTVPAFAASDEKAPAKSGRIGGIDGRDKITQPAPLPKVTKPPRIPPLPQQPAVTTPVPGPWKTTPGDAASKINKTKFPKIPPKRGPQ